MAARLRNRRSHTKRLARPAGIGRARRARGEGALSIAIPELRV